MVDKDSIRSRISAQKIPDLPRLIGSQIAREQFERKLAAESKARHHMRS